MPGSIIWSSPTSTSGGIIFHTERVGAFFYVAPGDEGAAKDYARSAEAY